MDTRTRIELMSWFLLIIGFCLLIQLDFAFIYKYYTLRNILYNNIKGNSIIIRSFDDNHNFVPSTDNSIIQSQIKQYGINTIKLITSLAAILETSTQSKQPVKAIGSLYELKQQKLVIQDISFNVIDNQNEVKAFNALFENTCKEIRKVTNKNEEISVISFGPDKYTKPESFYPGVSSFGENGGHATISFKSVKNSDSEISEFYERGNGLQYIKIGNDVIRLSKGINSGMEVKYAYGWVDIDSPSLIPLQLVVGISRDPIMSIALRVNNIQETTNFFTKSLGMNILPFPLARLPGSQFEQKQPEGSVYLGYGIDTVGILLIPSLKTAPHLRIGSLLNSISIIYDDESNDLPLLAQNSLDEYKSKRTEEYSIQTPEGYPITLIPYSVFKSKNE